MQKPTIAVVALVAGLTGSGPVHSSAPPAAPNGIEFPQGYQDWRVIGVSHRTDNNTLRIILGNDIAIEAADRNPAALIGVQKWTDRERVLSDAELRTIWAACLSPNDVAELSIAPGTTSALRLAAVTLQRGGEICGIHASEIDRAGRLWILPGERTKNHRSHVVPLSDTALSILDDAFALAMGRRSSEWRGYAFPSPRDKRKPVTRRALSRAMQRMCKATGIEDATPHDFRRTGSTNLTGERIGIPRFIVSRILNQISDTGGAATVTGVYDRNAYLTDKRRALDAWAALLTEIIDGRKGGSNVVQFG